MKQYFRLLLMAALLAAFVGTVGCSKKSEQQKTASPVAATTIDGAKISLEQYKGKVVLLDFFATWCPPCRASVPHLVELSNKYSSAGLQVVGLSVDEDVESLKKFVAEYKIPYPVAVASEETKTAYAVRSIPHLFIINRKGEIVEAHLGFDEQAAAAMETSIQKLIAEK